MTMTTNEQLTSWQLANLADCATPDREDSPGAVFLLGVQDAVTEAAGLEGDERADWTSDTAHEIADGAVQINTYQKWQTFVDLAAWQEDIEDYGSESSDMDHLSGLALYVIAERLAFALFEQHDANDDAPLCEDCMNHHVGPC